MTRPRLMLSVLPEPFAICRLEEDAPIPAWALRGRFVSITRTADELSIVCPESDVPQEIRAQRGWRCIKVQGPLDFSQTGILASLAEPLAEARISLFAQATYETDYVLVEGQQLEKSLRVLSEAGHQIQR
ncbi:MAG: ACT domain-containing protein [Acidobacteria bacterium]|nr:ACT domain-containing protein [Acidobacteriota bacterium]